MRQLSPAVQAALALPNPQFFLLAEINFSTPMRITSTSFDLEYNGNIYTTDGGIISFGPPRVSSSVDREIYELTFVDHADFFQGQLRAGINGKLLTVYVGFFNEFAQPLTSLADVTIAYRGFIDAGKITKTDEAKLGVIQAASPMANLDSIGGYLVSKDGMDQANTNDTSFDDVYSGGQTINLKWGKS
jgi:hypothetical protein